jgi:non-specific serine/threonine protein kinase
MRTELADEEVVDIVVNLVELAPDLYLPEAFIITRDHEGFLAHVRQKATPQTIGAFGLESTPAYERLFDLVAQLQPDAIEAHFYQSKRKAPKLDQLLDKQQPERRRALFQYVHRRLDELLHLLVEQGVPLSLNVDRRVLAKDYVIETDAVTDLEPEFHFVRTAESVKYRLRLREGATELLIRMHEVKALTNRPVPAWLILDGKLRQLRHLNGYVVKPFRTKDEVHIPGDKAAVYFRSFISRVVSKVDIQAEGFAVADESDLQTCRLVADRHPFSGSYVLSIYMVYPHAEFFWNESRRERTVLDMDTDEVSIIRVQRNSAAETARLDQLRQLGLRPLPEGSAFAPEEVPAEYTTLDWLVRHRPELEAAGFQIETPQVAEAPLYLHRPELQLKMDEGNDWLDLKGKIRIGEFELPFTKLVRHIREGRRLYHLPNGSLFVIPEEWFAKYADVLPYATTGGQVVRIERKHYSLLEHLDEAAPLLDAGTEEAEQYTPSPDLLPQLRPYQLAGVRWLVRNYHARLGVCLADDMGLGKTLQTIALLLYAKANKPLAQAATDDDESTGQLDLFAKPAADEDFLRPLHALIVLPASLVFNWNEEIRRHAPSLSVYCHTGSQRHRDARLLRRYDCILTTYHTALRDQELLRELNFEYIVLDESQQIKNRSSKVFKAVNSLRAERKLSLSGTPIENSLSDLWSQMQFLNPDLLKSYRFFRKQFIVPIEKKGDEVAKAKLRQIVQPFLLRRTKEEVARDLPELQTRVFYTEMTREQRKRYEEEKSAARNHLLDHYAPEDGAYRLLVVQTLTRLRQLANHPVLLDPEFRPESGKFGDVLEQWEVVRRSGHKVLFFSSFVTHLELFAAALRERGQDYAWLSGKSTARERQAAVRQFQEDPNVQAFFISIKSGGTGLNLTAADYVFLLDPWWNPTVEQQAIARAHRTGRENPVIALKYITTGTIEEKIVRLQEKKQQLAEDIIGKSDKLPLERSELAFLLE